MRTFEWAIEDIVAAYPTLSMDDCAAMAVALMSQSPPPCEFHVELDGFGLPDLGDDNRFILGVTWNAVTAAKSERLKRTKQRTPIVEGAAYALSALLLSHWIPDSEWDVAIRGDGADFWLPRMNQALEISGTERFGDLANRRREKQRQLLRNSRGYDGFVVLCCFEASHRLIQWIHCSQEKQ